MLEILGARQKELLKLLLKNKSGMTADELSAKLAITRNAVRQHLAALETDGLLKKGVTRASGGRPEQLYVLSDKGSECFPRHYAWFAQLLIESVQQEAGADALGDRLVSMGTRVGNQLRAQHPELVSRGEKVQKVSEIMEELGYDAQNASDNKAEAVVADNCVFHTLALGNPNICRFDLALLSAFTESSVDHQACMARGDNICRFKFGAKIR
ncbi:helix-turn-helix transcriptional regulator [Undibacterium sp. TJN25]|uniref:helix-turn-helix transcriptional regulator n=1 Tax=Undibacterium sp. TJN25 TaxID=3413056 RepID=UPI003BEFF735